MLLEKIISPACVADRLVVSVPYRVKGKARPRFDPRSNRAYMPKAYTLQVQDIQWLFRLAMFSAGTAFFTTDSLYAVEIKLIRKRRQPKSKKEAAVFNTVLPLGSFVGGKPDWDNAAGTTSDAGNGIVYGDDDQIALGLVYRVYGDTDGAEITVFKLVPNTKPLE